MSRDASIKLTFAGDERTFRLDYEGILQLQEACDCGYMEIYQRLATGRHRIEDVVQTILIGLLRAGTDPKIAKRWVENITFPTAEPSLIAHAILAAAISGDPREEVGKTEAATDETEAMTDAFPPPHSTNSPEPQAAQSTN